MKKNNDILTIFTPTYNRAYILEKLYKSLLEQNNKNFEWIIIDDESSDNTEDVVKKWINEENEFEIVYYKQKHGGKHRAINKALELAKGEFFFIVDSDDSITKDAVDKIMEWTNLIKQDTQIAGVSGTKISIDGKTWGGIPKFNTYIDATSFERGKYNLNGDKAEVYRTKILKKYKFPEFEGELFVTEETCYQEIAANGYKIRWYNYPIYICEYLEDGLSKNGANSLSGHISNYKGFCYYTKRALKLKPFEFKYIILKEYLKTAIYMKKSITEICKDINLNKIKLFYMIFIIAPLSFLKNKILKIYYKIGEKNERVNKCCCYYL